jgi:hypothetical protein
MSDRLVSAVQSTKFDIVVDGTKFTVVLSIEERADLNPIGKFLRGNSIWNDVERAIKEKLDADGEISLLETMESPNLGQRFRVSKIYKKR